MNPPGPSSLFVLKDRRILAIDDSAGLRVVGDMLRSEGCVVAEAETAAQAQAVYATFQPELVVLAATISGTDGREIGRQLATMHGDKCAPVVLMASEAEGEGVPDGLGEWCVDFLAKPLKRREVVARVRLHLRLAAISRQLAEVTTARNRFIGMAAHDLRGPLGSIQGVAEFLAEGDVGALSPDQLEMVEMIRTTSSQVLELVNELLDVAVIDSGELRLVLERWNLADLIAESVGLINMEAARKRIRVVFDPSIATTEFLFDAPKMKQVVDNLLSNAVKYSPPGSTVTVLIRPDAAAGTCAFYVRDQGKGIPPGEQEKLFKDFGRLSVMPTGGEKSTGLGLVICRKIVEAHGGTLTADNLPTRGCEFRVTLPARG